MVGSSILTPLLKPALTLRNKSKRKPGVIQLAQHARSRQQLPKTRRPERVETGTT